MVKLHMEAVKAFHDKLQVSPTQPMPTEVDRTLCDVARRILMASKLMEPMGAVDERWNRAHLIAEETGELIQAMGAGDEEKAFDGLIDLLYVVLGTAVTFDWPLAEGFEEVHRSNMTKEKQPTDVSEHRVRDKGPNYKAPDLQAVLNKYRQGE